MSETANGINALARLFDTVDSEVAAQVLMRANVPEDRLFAILSDLLMGNYSGRVRAKAAIVLAMLFPHPPTDEAIVEALKSERDEEVRRRLVLSLGEIVSLRSAETLVEIYKGSKNANDRELVIHALTILYHKARRVAENASAVSPG